MTKARRQAGGADGAADHRADRDRGGAGGDPAAAPLAPGPDEASSVIARSEATKQSRSGCARTVRALPDRDCFVAPPVAMTARFVAPPIAITARPEFPSPRRSPHPAAAFAETDGDAPGGAGSARGRSRRRRLPDNAASRRSAAPPDRARRASSPAGSRRCPARCRITCRCRTNRPAGDCSRSTCGARPSARRSSTAHRRAPATERNGAAPASRIACVSSEPRMRCRARRSPGPLRRTDAARAPDRPPGAAAEGLGTAPAPPP